MTGGPTTSRLAWRSALSRSTGLLGAIPFQMKVMGIVLFITLIVGAAATTQVRRDLYITLTEELESRGRANALDLAARGGDYVLTGDLLALNALLGDTLSHNQDILYAFFTGETGAVIADTFPEGVPPGLLSVPHDLVRRADGTSLVVLRTEDGLLRDVSSPILGGEAGGVRVGLSEKRVLEAVGAATRRLLYVTLIAAGAAVSIGLALSRILVAPLRSLVAAMRAVGKGDMTQRVPTPAADEIGFLAASFNQMTEELGRKTEQSLLYREHVELKNRELELLMQLGSEATGTMAPDAYLERAVGLVVTTLGAKGGRICLPQAGEHSPLVLTAGDGGAPALGVCESLCPDCPLSRGSADALVAQEAPRSEPQVGVDPAGCPGPGRERMMAGPIPLGRNPAGLLALIGAPSTLAGDDAGVVRSAAKQIGLVLENLRLREERRAREARLARLLSYTMRAQEGERSRIARELHDDMGQKLTYLKMGLKVLRAKLPEDQAIAGLADNLRGVVGDSLEGIQRMAIQLRPPALDHLGLLPALERLAHESAAAFGHRADFQALVADNLRLDPDREVVAYRVVQEALTNVGRHSGCRHVSLVVEQRGDTLLLVVEDDGAGFDVAAVLGDGDPGRHLGLDGMRERVELAGGKLSIESTLGAGTALHAHLPIDGDR